MPLIVSSTLVRITSSKCPRSSCSSTRITLPVNLALRQSPYSGKRSDHNKKLLPDRDCPYQICAIFRKLLRPPQIDAEFHSRWLLSRVKLCGLWSLCYLLAQV